MIKGFKIAATAIVAKNKMLPPSIVTIDDAGVVVNIAPLAAFDVEPAATRYFSGIITTDVEIVKIQEGADVRTLVDWQLEIGYSGRLLLWQNISAYDFIIKNNTIVSEIENKNILWQKN